MPSGVDADPLIEIGRMQGLPVFDDEMHTGATVQQHADGLRNGGGVYCKHVLMAGVARLSPR